ncbi:MAG: hypothetical protein LBV50_05370 [Novosphingobium sp.]|nr:hypothetical protein [Novosphingobium sp.]
MGGIDVTTPQAGFYRTRLTRGSVRVGVRLHHGPPLDPVTGEVLDRSWRWMADVNGEPFADFDRIWPACAGEPISEQEYRRYCARQDWARDQAPDSAYARPGRRLDPLSTTSPLPF